MEYFNFTVNKIIISKKKKNEMVELIIFSVQSICKRVSIEPSKIVANLRKTDNMDEVHLKWLF